MNIDSNLMLRATNELLPVMTTQQQMVLHTLQASWQQATQVEQIAMRLAVQGFGLDMKRFPALQGVKWDQAPPCP